VSLLQLRRSRLFQPGRFLCRRTKYHAGQLNAQLESTTGVIHVGIVNAVMAKARAIAELSLI